MIWAAVACAGIALLGLTAGGYEAAREQISGRAEGAIVWFIAGAIALIMALVFAANSN
jgi:hypothetical protein